jgi:ABC-type multidrug transport system permease subunit
MLLLLPLAITLINVAINHRTLNAEGYDITVSVIGIIVIFMFQFFGGEYMMEWLDEDFTSARRWRLLSTPVSKNRFIFPTIIASVLFSMAQGLVIAVILALFFNAYWHVGMLLGMLFLTALISQFIWMLLFLITKSKKAAEPIGIIVVFAMSILGGGFGGVNLATMSDSPVLRFLFGLPTPYYLVTRVMMVSVGAMEYDPMISFRRIAVLIATSLVLGTLVAILGKKRKYL